MHRAGKTTSTHNCVESSPLVAEKAGLVEVEKTKEFEDCPLVVDEDDEVASSC